ncbi:MAG TPA: response regulator transcription factor [Thermoanaerobaculia bacterium]|nr:response regulator transcription factor [Thermoanaerobaculia bacterium]
MITLILADDHTMVRHGLRALLSTDPELEIVAEASDGREALRLMEQHRPDVALIDVSMPGLSGVDVARAARDTNLGAAVLILSMHAGQSIVSEALAAGARGYVLKEAGADELLRAIHEVAAGGVRVLGSGVDYTPQDEQGDAQEPLTDRERDIVALIASGLANKEIAHELDISIRTVEAHRATAMRKLGLRSTAELTVYALQRGLLRLP